MLRLLIADDEKIIRETIRTLIDWESLGIQVVSVCKDGIEAWQSIIDDYPDIVMTDIKMPGISGLELLARAREADADTEFVILSGYSDFTYAQEAMRYGVRHYLLKPCNEQEIISVMQEVVENCRQKQFVKLRSEQEHSLSEHMKQSAIRNILLETLASKDSPKDRAYVHDAYVNLDGASYELCYFYYLEEPYLEDCLHRLYAFFEEKRSSGCVPLYPTFLYVRNTLMIFFESLPNGCQTLDQFVQALNSEEPLTRLEYHRFTYPSLRELLQILLSKVTRYETVYLIDGMEKLAAKNLNRILQVTQQALQNITSQTRMSDEPMTVLLDTLRCIDDPATLKTILADILLNQAPDISSGRSPISLTEFLMEISELDSSEQIVDLFEKNCPRLLLAADQSPLKQKDFIGKTLQYIDQNLSDSNLSLKSIAKNYLFMNVDYVSKQFMKQTGIKFSTYLANARIDKAKELLLDSSNSIYTVAEEVGFGNNPQYFSQIFKKSTGMTPTAYIKAMKGDSL